MFINNFIFIYPEIYLGFSILCLLLLGIYSKFYIVENNFRLILLFAVFIILFTLCFYCLQFFTFLNLKSVVLHANSFILIFDDYLILSSYVLLFKILLLFIFLLYLLIVFIFFKSESLFKYEFIIFILLALLGLLFLLMVNDFLVLYLALELQAIISYILCCFRFRINISVEAGLKLFIIGSFTSGLMVFGISLIYGSLGSLNFNVIFDLLLVDNTNIFVLLGIVFIFIAFFFKLGVVPFHLWLVDIYEGAPTLTVCFLAILPKISLGFLFFRLLFEVFGCYNNLFWFDLLKLINSLGLITLCWGIFGALFYSMGKLRSFFAYSSISNIGYFLLLVSLHDLNKDYILFLLFLFFLVYSITLLLIFILLLICVYWTCKQRSVIFFSELTGLAKVNVFLASIFLFVLLSLMGMPPLLGFFIKYLIISSFISVNLNILAFIFLFLSVGSVLYYLFIIKLFWFDEPNNSLFLPKIDIKIWMFLFFFCCFLFFFFMKLNFFLLIYNII